jgi:hypothetical protein
MQAVATMISLGPLAKGQPLQQLPTDYLLQLWQRLHLWL